MAEPLDIAIKKIAGGGVIAIPTDTVYGLACDPRDSAAVERIYAIKRRPAGLELTLLGADDAAFESLVIWNETARRLAHQHWPGALSIVLPVGAHRLEVPRQGSTVSVRVPAHPLVRELLAKTGPLATTSANRHGETAAATADETDAALGSEVDVVLDGGRGHGQASTIIDCSVDPPRLLRAGPIAIADVATAAQRRTTSEGTERD